MDITNSSTQIESLNPDDPPLDRYTPIPCENFDISKLSFPPTSKFYSPSHHTYGIKYGNLYLPIFKTV